jgi:hypothetical protein
MHWKTLRRVTCTRRRSRLLAQGPSRAALTSHFHSLAWRHLVQRHGQRVPTKRCKSRTRASCFPSATQSLRTCLARGTRSVSRAARHLQRSACTQRRRTSRRPPAPTPPTRATPVRLRAGSLRLPLAERGCQLLVPRAAQARLQLQRDLPPAARERLPPSLRPRWPRALLRRPTRASSLRRSRWAT